MTTDYKEDGIKYAMTTKGIWFCSELVIHTDNIENAVDRANNIMKQVNRNLYYRNKYKDTTPKKNQQQEKTIKKLEENKK